MWCIIAPIPNIKVHVSFWLTIEAICQSFVFSDNIQNEARFLLVFQLFPPLLILHQEILLVPLNLLQLLLARGVGFNLMIELIMKSSKTTYHRSQLIKISVLDKSGNKSIWSYLPNYIWRIWRSFLHDFDCWELIFYDEVGKVIWRCVLSLN